MDNKQNDKLNSERLIMISNDSNVKLTNKKPKSNLKELIQKDKQR